MKKLYSFALVCLGLISTHSYATSFAGNRPGALTLSGAVGYADFGSKRHIDNTTLGVAMVGYNLTAHWGVEGLLGMFNTKFKGWVHDNRKVNGTLFLFDGVYHFWPEHRVEPYLLAGVGIMGLNPSTEDANNEGNINAGVGFQVFPFNSLALRFDARDIYTMVGGKNDLLFTAGVSILIDLCK